MSPKSLRDIALEHVEKKHIEGAIPYCPQCGIPLNAGIPHGHYHENEPTHRQSSEPQKLPFTFNK